MSSCSVCEECVQLPPQTKPRQKNTFCASLVLPEGHQWLWAVFILCCQDRLRIDVMLMSALYRTMSSFSLITEPESDGTDLTVVLCLRYNLHRLTFTLSHLGLVWFGFDVLPARGETEAGHSSCSVVELSTLSSQSVNFHPVLSFQPHQLKDYI